jgi:hypothetical protein
MANGMDAILTVLARAQQFFQCSPGGSIHLAPSLYAVKLIA